MKDIEQLVRKYLQEGQILQMATAADSQPWSCTLYYVVDEDMNIYWISKRKSRHSKELEANPQIAASIPIKFDDRNVIGLQLQGTGYMVTDTEKIKLVAPLYAEKIGLDSKWIKLFIAGKSPYFLYQMIPTQCTLFDRVNFPIKEKVEWNGF